MPLFVTMLVDTVGAACYGRLAQYTSLVFQRHLAACLLTVEEGLPLLVAHMRKADVRVLVGPKVRQVWKRSYQLGGSSGCCCQGLGEGASVMH